MPNLRHDNFFELSIDMLCIADFTGHFLSVNQAFVDTLGHPKTFFLENPIEELIHPDDREKTNEEFNRLASGKNTLHFENRYKHALGHFRRLSWSAKVDQTTGLIYATARDVTEQTNIKNQLEQIKAGLQDETIYVETDVNGVITTINDRFCEISGYSREELLGRTHKIVNSGHHPVEFFEDLWKTISRGEVWSGVIKNRKKDGSFYYVQTIIIPVTSHDGRILKYVGIRQDITESIENSSTLAKTISILNETNSIAKVGGWELEIATGELTWTDETFNILEVVKHNSQKPMLEEGLQLFTPNSQPLIEEAVNQAITEGKPYSLELEGQTAKGNVKWVYTNGRPNFVNGEIKTLSGTIQDIDSRKKAEIAYGKERQRSIHNSKLASLGELAASMAHEINNPHGIITGYTELLLETGEVSPEVEEKLETILKSSDRIAHIVRSLRKFSTSNDRTERKAINILSTLNESTSLAKTRLKNELIDIELHGTTDCQVKCNEIELEQVFLNLINNSIDAIRELSVRWIHIHVTQESNSVAIAFTDSGEQIPETIAQQMFTPFFSNKPVAKGTGLGLAISREIIEEHNGSLTFEHDKPNNCFLIKLLLTEARI